MIRRVGGAAPYEQAYGYCRVVVAGDLALTAGTTAVGPEGVLHPGDPYAQARAAFEIALDALAGAGVAAERGDPQPDLRCGSRPRRPGRPRPCRALRRHPATMVVVTGLLDPAMLVEVELEAYVGPDAEPEVV